MNATTVREYPRPPLCERCGTEMEPQFNGDFPIVYKCPKCGHLCPEEDSDYDNSRDRGEDDF
jgi:tRNA(Ile2) C34 agmatinyltransferase TiaS